MLIRSSEVEPEAGEPVLTSQPRAVTEFDLAEAYADGDGVPQDDAEAVRWYRLAADQGYAEAQYNLGGMYENGRGVPEDHVQGHMWYNLAASRGVSDAVKDRDRLESRVPPAQIAEAQRLAREWDAAHPREP